MEYWNETLTAYNDVRQHSTLKKGRVVSNTRQDSRASRLHRGVESEAFSGFTRPSVLTSTYTVSTPSVCADLGPHSSTSYRYSTSTHLDTAQADIFSEPVTKSFNMYASLSQNSRSPLRRRINSDCHVLHELSLLDYAVFVDRSSWLVSNVR